MARAGQRPVSSSAPQANEPPEIVVGAMKWLPKPSLRTAVGLGAIAAVFLAMRPRQGNGEASAPGDLSAQTRREGWSTRV
jgi:hypothetical protein